jgi:heme ABC exporter ATP-binding subunit CcmA
MRLRAWDLTIERGGRRVIAELSFEAPAGSGLIVTGPNGAGKTSLLRALAGFLPIEAGGFALDGGDGERTVGEQAHYLGHADGVKAALTAGENLAFAAAMLAGDSSRKAQLAALAALGLSHVIDFPARLLSAGQRRRVALARLLVAERPLWLLDEPTTALDAAAQTALAAIMQAHLKGGGILVAAAHGSLGLDGAQELRLGATREAAEAPYSSPHPHPALRATFSPREGHASSHRAVEERPSRRAMGDGTLLAFSSLRERWPHATRPDEVLDDPALALFVREWRIARRIGGGASVGVVFFLILIAVMPFALGPDLNLLARLGPAILWIAALLATLLGLDRLFQADHEDGSLDLLINGSPPIEVVVLVKCAAHWAASALPLVVLSPLFGLMLAMAPLPLALVAAAPAAGTPPVTMIGALGAAFTV